MGNKKKDTKKENGTIFEMHAMLNEKSLFVFCSNGLHHTKGKKINKKILNVKQKGNWANFLVHMNFIHNDNK